MSGLIGQTFGPYRIISLLGEGGMAAVYRARQESIGRDVAFKVIQTQSKNSANFLKRFQREVETIAGLSHPHIIKVFDYGQQGDVVYLVMELLAGGSLADLIQKGPLPPDSAARILDQVASALDYAHERGIIHRDLKPHNVLLDEKGNAVLTDFGIAKILSDTTILTQSGVAMGTPAYMPPEHWHGQALDARADIYALGIMLFEMLTGQVPFNAETPANMMYKHLQEPPPPITGQRSDLPPGVDAVIAKALHKDREQRYGSASEMSLAFRSAFMPQSATGGNLTNPYPVYSGPMLSTPPVPSQSVRPTGQPRQTPAPGQTGTAPTTNRSQPMLLGIGAIVVVAIAVGVALVALSGGRGGATTTPSPTVGPSQTERIVLLPTLNSTDTPVPPTATNVPPTATVVPPTATAKPPTATAPPPTNTQVPPTTAPTNTLILLPAFTQTSKPPSATPLPPSATAVPPTATLAPPTVTPLPPTDSPIPASPTAVPPTAAPTEAVAVVPTAQPGTARTDDKQIAQVWVPGGCFLMGTDPAKDSAGAKNTDEQPQHQVCITKGFWLDQYSVTNAAYAQFIKEGGYTKQEYWSDAGWKWLQDNKIKGPQDIAKFTDPKQPRVGVSWYEAEAYARWRGGRLPTEAEREYAARGPKSTIYPWGDKWDPTKANVKSTITKPVDSYPDGKCWVGAYDLSGNVYEWTNDMYSATYYQDQVKDDPQGPDSGDTRVLRGGAWDYPEIYARGASRSDLGPDNRGHDIGFRIVTPVS